MEKSKKRLLIRQELKRLDKHFQELQNQSNKILSRMNRILEQEEHLKKRLKFFK